MPLNDLSFRTRQEIKVEQTWGFVSTTETQKAQRNWRITEQNRHFSVPSVSLWLMTMFGFCSSLFLGDSLLVFSDQGYAKNAYPWLISLHRSAVTKPPGSSSYLASGLPYLTASMGISPYMIVKNEEGWVVGAIESVRSIVDEVIIVAPPRARRTLLAVRDS